MRRRNLLKGLLAAPLLTLPIPIALAQPKIDATWTPEYFSLTMRHGDGRVETWTEMFYDYGWAFGISLSVIRADGTRWRNVVRTVVSPQQQRPCKEQIDAMRQLLIDAERMPEVILVDRAPWYNE